MGRAFGDVMTLLTDGTFLDGTLDSDVLIGLNSGPNHMLFGEAGNDLLIGETNAFWSGFSFPGNISVANAAAIDIGALWSVYENALITNSSIPHTTIYAEGEGGAEYFRFSAVMFESITLDIDFANFDTVVELLDSNGLVLATNDNSDAAALDAGSVLTSDSFLEFTAPLSGTYYVRVTEANAALGETNIEAGESFVLHISVTNHAANAPEISGSDHLDGGLGEDILVGNSGDDELYGGNGDDQLYGGSGNDVLRGQVGDDTYYFSAGDGNDIIQDDGVGGTDRLNFLDYDLADASFFQVRDTPDLLINFANGDSVLVRNTLNGSISDQIEEYSFADGQTLTAAQVLNIVVVEPLPPSDDVIIGTNSDDILQGGLGDDYIEGGDGSDTYIFNAGDGQDEILDAGDLDNDIVSFIGYASTDASFAQGFENANDLIITFAGGDSVTVKDALRDDRNNTIEQFSFDIDAVTFSVAEVRANILAFSATLGNDRLTGYYTDDYIVGESGNDYIEGGSGNDRLLGGAGDDRLFGGDGVDYLLGGEGADHLDGGAGIDRVYYISATAGVVFNVETGGTGGEAAGDSYENIEQYFGSSFADDITGSSLNDQLFGLSGDDLINGSDGHDGLYGHGGADTLNGELGNDRLYGGDGKDILNGGDGVDQLRGQEGDDTLNGGAGNDTLIGGAGADVLNGGAGLDRAIYLGSTTAVTINLADASLSTGDALGDTFSSIELYFGSTFDDTIIGDSSNNTLGGLAGHDTISGGDGNDRLFGHDGDDTLNGDAGLDFLSGQDGDDTLNGGDGTDTLVGGNGADVLNGGAGIDTVSYAYSVNGVVANMTDGSVNTNEAAGDSYIAVENIFGSTSDDILTGDSGNNMLNGQFGDDTLNGGDGNDALFGGEGADILNGGAGTDRVQYTGADLGVTANLADASLNTNSAAGDSYIDIENLYGSNLDDDLTGDANNNFVFGLNGNDTVRGGAGNDNVYGGNGDDMIIGGEGDDTLIGGNGTDSFLFDTGAGDDRILAFQQGLDTLVYLNDVFDFSELTITQAGSSVVIASAVGNISVAGAVVSDFAEDDFVFAALPLMQETSGGDYTSQAEELSVLTPPEGFNWDDFIRANDQGFYEHFDPGIYDLV